MLIVNRARALVVSDDGNFGYDVKFMKGLNIVTSAKNTRGKSSILLCIYYCLGLEEIIGGIGRKTLTDVFNSTVIDESGASHSVIESSLYLEITNGEQVVTIYRSGRNEKRDSRLVTISFATLDDYFKVSSNKQDYYVNSANSYKSENGFHNFLAKFLKIELPLVPTYSENELYLYFQLIFSCMFLEQKHGWGGIFSSMPYLGIRDAKRRVVEFVLALDTFEREKMLSELRIEISRIDIEWEKIISSINFICRNSDIELQNIWKSPEIISEEDRILPRLFLKLDDASTSTLEDEIGKLSVEIEDIKRKNIKISKNYTNFKTELELTEKEISRISNDIQVHTDDQVNIEETIRKLRNSFEVISKDILNNEDVIKLKKFGSVLGLKTMIHKCPVCNQETNDSLLLHQNYETVMSEDENIHHLKSQKELLQYSIFSNTERLQKNDGVIHALRNRMSYILDYAKALRNDIISTDEEISEAVVFRKITIDSKLSSISKTKLQIEQLFCELYDVSDRYKDYLVRKDKVSNEKYTILDEQKINYFENAYTTYLGRFGYTSIDNFKNIRISKDTYLPTSDGFDMKFGSSASDNIRSIWSFTISLLATSLDMNGNHPGIVVIDEPAQQSMVPEDLTNLFSAFIELQSNSQAIFAVTASDPNLKEAIENLKNKSINVFDVGSHSLKRLL